MFPSFWENLRKFSKENSEKYTKSCQERVREKLQFNGVNAGRIILQMDFVCLENFGKIWLETFFWKTSENWFKIWNFKQLHDTSTWGVLVTSFLMIFGEIQADPPWIDS